MLWHYVIWRPQFALIGVSLASPIFASCRLHTSLCVYICLVMQLHGNIHGRTVSFGGRMHVLRFRTFHNHTHVRTIHVHAQIWLVRSQLFFLCRGARNYYIHMVGGRPTYGWSYILHACGCDIWQCQREIWWLEHVTARQATTRHLSMLKQCGEFNRGISASTTEITVIVKLHSANSRIAWLATKVQWDSLYQLRSHSLSAMLWNCSCV